MQFRYISSVMQADDFAALFPDRSSMPGQQAQKYHRLMIEGLARNGVKVQAISDAPITTRNYAGKIYQGGRRTEGNISFRYLPVINLPGIKPLCQLLGAFFSVLCLPKAKEQVVVCDVLNASAASGAVKAAKLRGIPCVGVVTDLPDMMVTGGSEKYVRWVRENIKGCTHYVLLTEQMNAVVNPDNKPYTIIEGVSDFTMQHMEQPERKEGKTCLYAGLLDARYGVKRMVEAFIKADVPSAKLEIYGSGPYAEELRCRAAEHPNVVYHGNVLNEEVVAAELQASVLVNPRPTNEEFTKYSFPSKNMEYMASGTAVLTTDLPGIPEEYSHHVYLFKDETEDGMAETFRQVLAKTPEELAEKGAGARKFVLEEKNNVVLSRKLIGMLER